MNDKLIQELKEIARTKCIYDDEEDSSDIYDHCGGNFDDAFYLGEKVGETLFARKILKLMNIIF